jgi:ComF family protein
VNQLIQHFKYEGDLAAGHSLASLAAETLADMAGSLDLLIPIPLHWRRYWQRGFNQAQLLAETFGHAWQLPVQTRGLRKRHASDRQQSLDRRQRLRNLSGSFAVRAAVKGRRVGLVDDVITTGATMEAAASALLEAGAAQVSAIALARTP